VPQPSGPQAVYKQSHRNRREAWNSCRHKVYTSAVGASFLATRRGTMPCNFFQYPAFIYIDRRFRKKLKYLKAFGSALGMADRARGTKCVI